MVADGRMVFGMGDYISREAFRDKAYLLMFENKINDRELYVCNVLLDTTPNADVVERKRGDWNFTWHSVFKEYLPTCSCCGRLSVFKYNFCPECGAYMRQDPLAEKPCDNCSQDKCTIAETGSCDEARMVTDGQDKT